MNDLHSLFGSTSESSRVARPVRADVIAATLRELVGTSPEPDETIPSKDAAADLKAFVKGGGTVSPVVGARGLETLVGLSGPLPEPTTNSSLSDLVGSRGASTVMTGWAAPESAKVGDRPLFGGRRRAGAVNFVSLITALLAVIAIVSTASLAVVQRATANPADDAMSSLREREAELANDTKVLETAVDLYDGSVSEATALAGTSGPVFAALEGRVSPATLSTAEAALASLRDTATAAAPITVPQYQRGVIDEKSLAEVGGAIDAVRQAREALPPLIASARDARADIASALSGFRGNLTLLGSALQVEAANLVEENDAAGQSYRSAVVDAAMRVASAQQAGGDGLGEMPAFALSVDALRAENDRVQAGRDIPRTEVPTRPSSRAPDSGGSDSGGETTPPEDSVTPDPSPSPAPSESQPPADTPTDSSSASPLGSVSVDSASSEVGR